MTDSLCYNGPRMPDSPGRYIPRSIRSAVHARDGYACRYCGVYDSFDMDHVYPWSQGGTHDPTNLVVACGVCNSIAGERVYTEFTQKKAYILARRAILADRILTDAYDRLARGLTVSIE